MKNDAGFSLVEVMVSIVLLAIGLIGLLTMLTTAMSANRFSYDGTTGVQLAEYMVDVIRLNGRNDNARYDGMDTDAIACATDTVDCGPWQQVLLDSGMINPRGTVSVIPDTPTDRVDTVTVEVEWGPGDPGSSTRRKTTLRTILETWRS